MIRLDIGSGTPNEYIEGDWIRVDPFVEESDVKAKAWELPYKNCSVHEIWSSHMLEHLPKFKVKPTLEEWWRVLKWGGKLTIRVPDLEWCCKWWLEHQTIGWDMDIIYGGQSREGEAHQTGFTRQIMTDYLTEVGFKIEKFEELQTHSQQTLSFKCVKRLDIE